MKATFITFYDHCFITKERTCVSNRANKELELCHIYQLHVQIITSELQAWGLQTAKKSQWSGIVVSFLTRTHTPLAAQG